MIEIGSNMRRYREEAGLTQERLARKADITMGMVSKIERGEHTNPTIETIEKIANGLGVSVAELLSDSEIKVNSDNSTL